MNQPPGVNHPDEHSDMVDGMRYRKEDCLGDVSGGGGDSPQKTDTRIGVTHSGPSNFLNHFSSGTAFMHVAQ